MSAVEMLARARCERHWRTPCDMAGCTEFSCEWRAGAEADLAALSAAGWVVVPREPTEAMQQAAPRAVWGDCWNELDDDAQAEAMADCAVIYRAMIAAAAQEAADDGR